MPNRQRNDAVSAQLAAQSEQLYASDSTTASLLAAAAWQIAPTAQARESMLDVLAQPQRATLRGRGQFPHWLADSHAGLAFSYDGKILATVSADGTARLWNTFTYHQIGQPIVARGVRVTGVAFSPNGKVLATADGDGTARQWSTLTRRQIGGPIIVSKAPVLGVAFSPDGRGLATASNDGSAQLWNVVTRRQIGMAMTTAGATPMWTVAFSPDGKVLATTGEDGIARLWSVATDRQIRTIGRRQHVGFVLGVAFSPDGTLLATVGIAGLLWSVANGHQIGKAMAAGSTDAYGVAFSPDGKTMVTADSDGTIRMWNVATQRQARPPIALGGRHEFRQVVFSPAGDTLATTEFRGPVRVWDVSIYHQIGQQIKVRLPSFVEAVAFNPEGKILATAGDDGMIRLWNEATRSEVGRPILATRCDRPPAAPRCNWRLLGLTFSSDGQLLVAEVKPGKIRLWDVIRRRQVGKPIALRGSRVLDVSISPSGKILAIVVADKKSSLVAAQLWDVAAQRPIGVPITNAYGVAFGPDGRTLAITDGQTIRLLDLSTLRRIGLPMLTGGDDAESVAFSLNGRILAAWGLHGIRLWDLETYHQIGPVIAAGENPADVADILAFSPDGNLATVNGLVRLWDARFPGKLLNAVCSIAGRDLTDHEWYIYIPSIRYRNVCH